MSYKVYTKTGDRGTTSLTGGERVSKADLRVEAYGTVDELTANVGMLHDVMESYDNENVRPLCDELERICSELMTVAALFSQGSGSGLPDFKTEAVKWLEERIDSITSRLSPAGKFTLPMGHPLVSGAHICRTVCRRAERAAIKAGQEHPLSENGIIYLNRLSDYLYVLSRLLSDIFNAKEKYWVLE